MIDDKIIVGAMCISENIDILKITIPNLLKFSDWVLLMLDNETEEVKQYALKIQKENYDKVWLRRSSIPHDIVTRNGNVLDYHKRWKAVKGIIRDEAFVNLRRILKLKQKGYEKIDILLFPDADECFTDYLLELLEKFINSNYKAISLKHIHVVDNMQTIKDDKMMSHVHIFKWLDDLHGYPWQYRNAMHPIKWSETMIAENYSIHLCYLSEKIRNWRNKNWKNVDLKNEKLYKISMSVEKMRPEEIKNILNS
jgi:hypothetical protein